MTESLHTIPTFCSVCVLVTSCKPVENDDRFLSLSQHLQRRAEFGESLLRASRAAWPASEAPVIKPSRRDTPRVRAMWVDEGQGR